MRHLVFPNLERSGNASVGSRTSRIHCTEAANHPTESELRILLDESDRPDRWHLAVSIPSTGNPNRLEDAIEQLIALHPALRTSFRRTTNGWIRSILPAGPVGVVEIGGPGLQAWMQQPFDLAHEYPIRFARSSGRLIAVIHHLVADGFSLALLARDLNHFLHGKVPSGGSLEN